MHAHECRKFAGRLIDSALIIALIVLPALVWHRFQEDAHPRTSGRALSIGDTVRLQDAPFKQAERTVVLALSPNSRYCRAGREFYRTLFRAALAQGVPTILAVPERAGMEELRDSIGIPSASTRIVNFGAIGIAGTPMVLVVDRNGRVRRMWIGGVSPRMQQGIVASLGDERMGNIDIGAVSAEISDALFATIKNERDVLVLDVRPREEYAKGHLPNAANIPHDELETRVVAEVPRSTRIVVDCTHYFSSSCDDVGGILQTKGFESVLLLNKGAFATPACKR